MAGDVTFPKREEPEGEEDDEDAIARRRAAIRERLKRLQMGESVGQICVEIGVVMDGWHCANTHGASHSVSLRFAEEAAKSEAPPSEEEEGSEEEEEEEDESEYETDTDESEEGGGLLTLPKPIFIPKVRFGAPMHYVLNSTRNSSITTSSSLESNTNPNPPSTSASW